MLYKVILFCNCWLGCSIKSYSLNITIGDEVTIEPMATIGHIETYNRDSEDWLQYTERLKFYFQANRITDEDQNRASFLSIIWPATFKTLCNILAPSSPGGKSHDELIQALTEHFRPRRSQIYYRSLFYRCSRQTGEPVSLYLSKLRSLANACEFGTTLNIMLRDHLVCGINDASEIAC